MHVFLIGFMCSGKSTVGRLLAPMLGLPFIDVDRVIEQRVGPLVPFFAQHGEQAFRAREADVLAELVAGPAAVIATGGGTPCEPGNFEAMAKAGTVVWLDVHLRALMPRIVRAGGDRPLLLGLQGAALEERVVELLTPRLACYAKAHLQVDGAAAPGMVAGQIARMLGPDQLR